jgi:hypothetical protein
MDEKLPDAPEEYKDQLKLVLDAFGYEEAAEMVYGSTVGEWKKKYQTKATDAQMYVPYCMYYIISCVTCCSMVMGIFLKTLIISNVNNGA